MKTSLVYTLDWFNGMYARHNTIDEEYNVGNGRIAAHDFIEHPRGFPTGELEDELAAYGAIAKGRLNAGMLRGFLCAPDVQLGEEVKELIRDYADQDPETDRYYIKPRRRISINDGTITFIAEYAAEGNWQLANHIEAWMQYGAKRFEQRFNNQGAWIFEQFEDVFDNIMKHHGLEQFSIRIDGNTVDSYYE